MSSAEQAAALLREWRGNVTRFAWDNFRFEPDAWQRKFFDVFPSQDKDKIRIALKACAGPGKTAVLSIAGWNFLSCYGEKGFHPKGAAVAVTAENLRDNLWAEFAVWHNKSPYLLKAFTWTKQKIFANDHPETWFLSARSWSKSASPEEQGRTLSGLHAKYVLVLIDESGDIPPSVLRAGDQALGNVKWGKMVQSGNPTSLSGMLYEACAKLAHQWYAIEISGDPDDPDRSPRVDIEFARDQIANYGRGNPWVMSYILGKFPPSSINSLLGVEEVAAAMKRHLHLDQYQWAQKRLGVDCARFGDDRTVIFPRQGLAAFNPVTLRNARSHEISGRVITAKMKWGSEMELVDDTGGWGAGTIDSMLLARIAAYPINSSSRASDPRFYNLRSEMHWKKAEWVKRGGALPDRGQLKREMTAPVYWYEGGKLRVEEKAQIKKRLKFSPDEDDALGLTFAIPDMPGTPTDPATAAARQFGQEQSNRTVNGGVHDPYANT